MTQTILKKIEHDKRRGCGQLLAFRFIGLLLIAFAVYGAAVPQAHASAGEHSLGAEFGQVLLMGDFSKNFSDSLGFRVSYEYDTSDMFGLLAQVSYSEHTSADDANRLAMWGFLPNLKVNMAYFDKIVLYSFGGFGLFKVTERLGSAHSGSVTTFGFNLGGGFELTLSSHFKFNTALSFHNVFNKADPNAGPGGLNIGGTFGSLFLGGSFVF